MTKGNCITTYNHHYWPVNKPINDNLEKSMSTLFDFYFGLDNSESNKYKGAFLTDIATFINGLAMQKFRPKEDEKEFLF
jgi:type I restriction enzyme S subunit